MSASVTVGLDGSPEGHGDAERAAREAELRGLPLRLAHVWEPVPSPWRRPRSCGPRRKRTGSAAARSASTSDPSRTRYRTGPPLPSLSSRTTERTL
ncbi:hypothetical protein QFZ32_000215 [Streptomyces canus]|nr:hypothetical protein [Streptomyces canus]MDQ1064776.1 hypothetical protein [Streptomyces canus]